MRRTIKKLYIHHSESPLSTTVSDIRRWHVQENKWSDIGYHYILTANGTLEQGRPVEQAGAHVQGDNATSIGLCVIGDFDVAPPTNEQIEALEWFIPQLCTEFGITKDNVFGHRDGPNVTKTCPGKFLYDMLPKIRSLI